MISPRIFSLAKSVSFSCALFASLLISVPCDAVDSSRQIPAYNIVDFSPINASVSIELKSSNDVADQSFAGTRLLAIDSSGKSRQFIADDEGVVLIDNVREGLYAFVASSETAHGAVLMSMRESEDETSQVAQDLFEQDFLPEAKRELIPMTMMAISADQIVPIIKNNLPETVEASFNLVKRGSLSRPRNFDGPHFDIKLGKGGGLRGNLLSVIPHTSVFSAVSGTNVVVFKNGKPVGTTRANALGQFQLNGLEPGIHGVMVAGRGGYAAFSINVSQAEEEKNASNDESSSGYIYASIQFTGDIVQVALVPPPMLPQVMREILSYYPQPVVEDKVPVEDKRPTENQRPKLRDSESPKRLEIAGRLKSKSTFKSNLSNSPTRNLSNARKRNSRNASKRGSGKSILVLDQTSKPRQIGRGAPSARQIHKRLRPIPVNPLRQTTFTRVVPTNPLRP